MKLIFLGTRGYINSSNSRHRRHTSTLVSYRDKKVMIDCGEDWLGKLKALAPDAIVITHPHPDHAFCLTRGTPCPVYATEKAWEKMRGFPIGQANRRILAIRRAEKVARLVAEVGFTEWTEDNRLRHPRYLGLRTDKKPQEIVRERPKG